MSAPTTVDRFASARAIADAVLYEGYVLYPYRASSGKNQVRWQFGVLAPRAYSEREGSERWAMRTECIVDPGDTPTVAVRIRCLQVQRRSVETYRDGAFVAADRLDCDGTMVVPWDEAVEHTIEVASGRLLPLADAGRVQSFRLPAGEDIETVVSPDGTVAGRVVRRRQPVDGRVTISAEWAEGPGALVKLTIGVENASPWDLERSRRDDAIVHALVAVHTMLAVDDGTFVSLLDPPPDASAAVAACASEGTFPVLIGAGHDVVLSSPIILYDQPEIAPESPGDLYDATEIDEILALRVLTLTDEEKAEARGTDPRAAAIIDRCDHMPPELWSRLHGAIRAVKPFAGQPVAAEPEPEPSVPWWDPATDASVDPWSDSIWIAGVLVGKGSAVVLRPSHRADAHDIFTDGMNATVTGVFRDVDGNDHVAVTIDDDPATEALAWQGRYLFFHPDEIEPLDEPGAAR